MVFSQLPFSGYEIYNKILFIIFFISIARNFIIILSLTRIKCSNITNLTHWVNRDSTTILIICLDFRILSIGWTLNARWIFFPFTRNIRSINTNQSNRFEIAKGFEEVFDCLCFTAVKLQWWHHIPTDQLMGLWRLLSMIASIQSWMKDSSTSPIYYFFHFHSWNMNTRKTIVAPRRYGISNGKFLVW